MDITMLSDKDYFYTNFVQMLILRKVMYIWYGLFSVEGKLVEYAQEIENKKCSEIYLVK